MRSSCPRTRGEDLLAQAVLKLNFTELGAQVTDSCAFLWDGTIDTTFARDTLFFLRADPARLGFVTHISFMLFRVCLGREFARGHARKRLHHAIDQNLLTGRAADRWVSLRCISF
jgi:hypothetical protein